MMQRGYAGLPNERKRTPDLEAIHDDSASASSQAQSAQGRPGMLHVVAVDRRSTGKILVPEIAVLPAPGGKIYHFSKRVFDIVGACLAIVFFAPFIIVIIACAHFSGGPALFKHRRVGQGGRFFHCIKFRTMVPNADQVLQNLLNSNREIKEEWLRDHKLRDDPRVTRVGKFLRRTSLDELPQLWNVLRGEMSLVGPRPVVPDELFRYGNKVSTFLSARPGITGLWQVSGRNNTDYRRRVALDVCYVRSRSLLLDVYILIKTLPVVFARNGAY